MRIMLEWELHNTSSITRTQSFDKTQSLCNIPDTFTWYIHAGLYQHTDVAMAGIPYKSSVLDGKIGSTKW